MAFVLDDRVKEQSSTTGTGTFTLGSSVDGFQTFAAIGDGNTTYYTITLETEGEWEVGIGTYTSSGTTLSRDTILASTNSDAAVNFSAGTKDVFVTQPASKAVYTSASPTFTGLTLTGAVSGTSGVFSGTVSAATFDGALIGDVTGDVTGNIDGATGSFSTEVSATAYKGGSLTLTGIVSGRS